MQKFKELTERKNSLIVRAEEILAGASEDKRELTDAEAQELAEIRDDVKKIKDALGIIDEIAEEKIEENTEEEEMAEERAISAEEQQFEQYLRARVFEVRDTNLTPAVGSGEVLIPSKIANKIVSMVYDICPVLEKSSKYNYKGDFEIPYYDEGTTAITVQYASEFEDLTSSVGAFTNITLGGFLCGALTKVSKKLINNTDFNIVDFVVKKMAENIAMFIEKELLNGTTNKVAGLSGVTTLVRASTVSAIEAENLIDLKDAVKDAYQQNAIFIMNSSTRNALRKLTDDVGRFLLNDDITSPFGTTLLGKPVYVSDNMPEISDAGVVIYYGDMSGLATKFSEDINIEILREKYSTQHAIGVVGWCEFDAKVENQQKLAKLTMAQS